MSHTGLSRYESDFQELKSLGKGGYGVVVSAINRLDGRQYAVKKIKMQSQSPQGFSRLIREVTTLSRLQHPHVVRYFQACVCLCWIVLHVTIDSTTVATKVSAIKLPASFGKSRCQEAVMCMRWALCGFAIEPLTLHLPF